LATRYGVRRCSEGRCHTFATRHGSSAAEHHDDNQKWLAAGGRWRAAWRRGVNAASSGIVNHGRGGVARRLASLRVLAVAPCPCPTHGRLRRKTSHFASPLCGGVVTASAHLATRLVEYGHHGIVRGVCATHRCGRAHAAAGSITAVWRTS